MFDKEYIFRGIHAEKVVKLTSEFDKNHNKVFNRNIDVYMMAPLVGFLYQRKASLDRDTKEPKVTKIFIEQLINEKLNLQFSYRLILLLDKEYMPDLEERINHAFRYYDSEKAKKDEELFEDYVRGGVDVLYEKIIEPSKTEEDYINNIYYFFEEFDSRYNKTVDKDSINNLINLARS